MRAGSSNHLMDVHNVQAYGRKAATCLLHHGLTWSPVQGGLMLLARSLQRLGVTQLPEKPGLWHLVHVLMIEYLLYWLTAFIPEFVNR